MDTKAYCPEGHELERLAIHLTKNWKGHITYYITGLCLQCKKTYIVGDEDIQTGELKEV